MAQENGHLKKLAAARERMIHDRRALADALASDYKGGHTEQMGAGNITIEVSLVRGVTPADGNGFCDIGRMAEVRFQRSGFGLSQAMSWFFHRKPASELGSRVARGLSTAPNPTHRSTPSPPEPELNCIRRHSGSI